MDSKRQSMISKWLLLVALTASGCQQRTEEGSIASTHPELQEQLAEKPVTTPISGNDTPELYERYRITTEEYRHSGQFAETDMYSGAFAALDEKSHPDSRLFILNPPDSSLNYAECPDCAPQAYEFRDGRFMKLPEPAP